MCFLPSKVLMSMIEHFQILNPIILEKNLTNTGKIKLLKIFSINGLHTKFGTKVSHRYQSFIVILSSLQDFQWEIQTNVPVLVVSKIQNIEELRHINLPLDAEVYFVDHITFNTYEAYTINNINITRHLGQFRKKIDLVYFNHATNVDSLFIKRRGNFNAIELKGMTERGSLVHIPKGFEYKANYFENNQTYDVTDFASGKYINMLKSLENVFNFTTRLYKRKDGEWGSPRRLRNGTVAASGMVRNILDGSVGFAWAGFSLTINRSQYLDFLPVTDGFSAGIFIPNEDKFQDIDWTVYVYSFSIQLWGILLGMALIFALFAYISEWTSFKKRPVSDNKMLIAMKL